MDVLISLAFASNYFDGPTCRPSIRYNKKISSNEVEAPFVYAKGLRHPILAGLAASGSFVPNDVNIGGLKNSSFMLLTGPNMGGKSTLLRQVCLAIILAQLGADVPAEEFQLSPVDRIFVRMGARDHIMAAQSTFLVELSETASMLSSATRDSFVHWMNLDAELQLLMVRLLHMQCWSTCHMGLDAVACFLLTIIT